MTKSRGIQVRTGTRPKWVAANQGKHFCQCGCGGSIPLRPEHFNVGIPRYLHGHNTKVNPPKARKPIRPATPCECGCGDYATPGRRYISGHNGRGVPRSDSVKAALRASKLGEKNPRYGKRPSNYKGRTTNVAGYVLIHSPQHPFRSVRQQVMEHRLNVEEHLRATDPTNEFLVEVDGGLYLSRDVDVHHLNGIKGDNRLENLKPMWAKDHRALHHADLIEASRRVRAERKAG